MVGTWLETTLLPSLKRREESAVPLTTLPEGAPEWLVNKWDTCGPFHEFRPDAALTERVGHIRDWLEAARAQDAAFLKDLDAEGRPKKLVQLDLEGAYNAAEKYFARLNQKFRAVAVDDEDMMTVMRFDNGSRVVLLLTPNARKAEGAAMGHCVGGAHIDARQAAGTHFYYSLRDAGNRPHVTFEVEGDTLLQCRAKQNNAPLPKYMPMVQAFITKQKLALKEMAKCTGLARGADGAYHSIYALPENFTTEGELNLAGCKDLVKLPAGMTVNGTLDLDGCNNLDGLPENLSVRGRLYINGCSKVMLMPKGLKVSEWIYCDIGVYKTPAHAASVFASQAALPREKRAMRF